MFCFLHFVPLVHSASGNWTQPFEEDTSDLQVYETGTAHPPWDSQGATGEDYLRFGKLVTTYYGAGVLIENIAIPNGSIINDAYLYFQADVSDTGTCDLRIAAEDVDTASLFTDVANYNGRARTSYISWAASSFVGDAYYSSPNLTSIVQTVINRAGWVSGNEIVFFIEDDGAGTSTTKRQVGCTTGTRTAPILYVTWTVSTAPEYDYVDSQTNVDSHTDHGTHSSFTAQKATDWTNDSLIEANTNTTALNNAENFVDSNTSNIDSHTGHGTSSNFTAQQDANVLYNDTLTEANVPIAAGSEWLSCDSNDTTYYAWTEYGTAPYLSAIDWTSGKGGNYIQEESAAGSQGWFGFPSTTGPAGGVYTVNISIYCNNDDGPADDYADVITDFTGGSGTDIGDCAGHTAWAYDNFTVTNCDTATEVAALRVYFAYVKSGGGDDVRIDYVRIGVSWVAINNYELDYEFSWTTADYDEANEYLCIRTNSYTGTAENLGVDVWDGSWKSISASLTASAWNNISITTNLTGATIYFRFIGKTESSDTAQNTWVIECNLIHTWSVGVNYELDLEEQFTGANFSRTSVELCVRMGAYNTTENLRLDYWNASASAWIVAVATLTTNIWNNVSVKTYTSNASVTFTVRFVGVTESGDTERSMWDKDACLLHTWDSTENYAPTNDACDSTATFSVDTDSWVNMTVSDQNLVADLKTVQITVTTSDAKTFVLLWTQATGVFSETSDESNICILNTGGSVRVNVDSDTDKIAFLFRINADAQKGNCNVQTVTTDDSSETDTDTYTSEFAIAFYSSITIATASHTWTNATTGIVSQLIDETWINFTVTANVLFKIQAKAGGNLVNGSDIINIGNVTIHKDTLGSAIPLTTEYADVVGWTSQTMGQNLELYVKLWLSVPSTSQPWLDFHYTLYLQVTEQ